MPFKDLSRPHVDCGAGDAEGQHIASWTKFVAVTAVAGLAVPHAFADASEDLVFDPGLGAEHGGEGVLGEDVQPGWAGRHRCGRAGHVEQEGDLAEVVARSEAVDLASIDV